MTRSSGRPWAAALVVAATTAAALGTATPAGATAGSDAQVVSGNAFLASAYTEAGSRPNGSFGSDVDSPTGYHSQSGQGDLTLGFRVDRDKDGWGVGSDDGDFFTPGSPFEGWGFQVGDAGTMRWNDDGQSDVAGTWGSPSTSSGASVTWTSDADVDGLAVQQVASIASGGQTLHVMVTLTNHSGAPVTNLYYARGVDPDNCQTQTSASCVGSYDTTNTIVKQGALDGQAVVSATAPDGSFLGLKMAGAHSVAATNFFSPCGDLDDIYTVGGTCTGSERATKGDTITDDQAIYVVGVVPTVADGAATTFSVDYFLSEDAANHDSGTAPGAPTAVTATGRDRKVDVTFAVPASDGGSAITSYQYRLGSGPWVTVTTTAGTAGHRRFSVTGLVNGRTYAVSVRAVNAVGAGSSASGASALVNAARPSAPGRAGAVPVPAEPKAYRGSLTKTRAVWTAHDGTTAWGASTLRGHHLVRHEATTLDGAGLFAFDDATLSPAAKRQVRAVAALLDVASSIRCEGYADYAGTSAHELALSKARARTVCAALRAAGADVRSATVGYGRTRPAYVGGTADDRVGNRRVVIYVVS